MTEVQEMRTFLHFHTATTILRDKGFTPVLRSHGMWENLDDGRTAGVSWQERQGMWLVAIAGPEAN